MKEGEREGCQCFCMLQSTFQNSEKVKAKEESTCILGSKTKRYFHAFISRKTDKQNVVYTFKGTLLSLGREVQLIICYNMDDF